MPDTPEISVVIPCFNGEKYLATAIRSVLAQNWPSIEIIVVDDGSTDQSARLVKDSFPGVKLVQQANQGVAAARNHGIDHATADWIAFLDADDVWLEGKLARQWQQLQDNPGVRMNYTAWQVWQSEALAPSEAFTRQLQALGANPQHWGGPSGWIYPALLLDCEVWTSTVLAHRSVFEEVGNFDTSLRIGEDYDLWLRASRCTQILRVPQPLALYRTHAASITKAAPAKNYKGLVIQRALDRWALRSPDGRSASKSRVAHALARTWSDFALASLAAGQMAPAWHAGLMSIKTRWQQLPGWKVLVKTMLQTLAGTRTRRG